MPKSTGRKKRQREAEQREHVGNVGRKTQGGQNIGGIERVVSNILGGTLLLGGLARRSLPGLALATMGAAFLYRGTTGHCKVYESLGLDTYRNTLNSDRSVDLLHGTARLENSLEEKQLSSKPRRMQTAKPMAGTKGIGKAATVSYSSKMNEHAAGL